MDKMMEEGDGIASAGNANEMARIRREPAKQNCLSLNPIHPVVASNVRRLTMNDHRHLDKTRSWRRLHHKRRVHIMNNKHESTYALLVRSEETGRSVMETVAYALFGLSAIVSIWQFAQQPNQLPIDRETSRLHPALHMSHRQ